MHCKYLSVVPYKALEKFSKALYGTTGSTYSAPVFRPVMLLTKQDKNTTNNTTNNTTKIRYVNYLLHSTSLQYTTFTFFRYYTPICLANYNPGEVST